MNITLLIIIVTAAVSILGFYNKAVFYRLSLNPYSVLKKNQWYRLLTYGFVHADFWHLFINMFVLWSFGSSIESVFAVIGKGNPSVIMLVFYLSAIIFSTIPDLVRHRNNSNYNSVGASGAVSAALFAMIFLNPWGIIYVFIFIPIPMPSIIFGIAYIWYSQYMNRRGGDNVNHMAHIFGALYGILFLILLKPSLVTHFFKALISVF